MKLSSTYKFYKRDAKCVGRIVNNLPFSKEYITEGFKNLGGIYCCYNDQEWYGPAGALIVRPFDIDYKIKKDVEAEVRPSSTTDKWLMFKNYIHNDLNITKDDIRGWIEDAVNEQIKALLNQEVGRFSVESRITSEVKKMLSDYRSPLKESISNAIAKRIVLTMTPEEEKK